MERRGKMAAGFVSVVGGGALPLHRGPTNAAIPEGAAFASQSVTSLVGRRWSGGGSFQDGRRRDGEAASGARERRRTAARGNAIVRLSPSASTCPSSSPLLSTRRRRCTRKRVRVVTSATQDSEQLVGCGASENWAHSVGSSRFPADWNEALEQAGRATCDAIAKGETRILVELCPPMSPLALLEALIKPIVAQGPRVRLFFDSQRDWEHLGPKLSKRWRSAVSTTYLGRDPSDEEMSHTDVGLLFQPNNIDGYPRKIEDVERLHYRLGWTEICPLVIVNPKLMSLGSGLDAIGNVRPPMFIGDYTYSYFLDPKVFCDDTIHGALLCQYPRKWEMYVFRDNGGFRLIAQYRAKPNADKVLVQFLWRSDLAKSKAVAPSPRSSDGGMTPQEPSTLDGSVACHVDAHLYKNSYTRKEDGVLEVDVHGSAAGTDVAAHGTDDGGDGDLDSPARGSLDRGVDGSTHRGTSSKKKKSCARLSSSGDEDGHAADGTDDDSEDDEKTGKTSPLRTRSTRRKAGSKAKTVQ